MKGRMFSSAEIMNTLGGGGKINTLQGSVWKELIKNQQCIFDTNSFIELRSSSPDLMDLGSLAFL